MEKPFIFNTQNYPHVDNGLSYQEIDEIITKWKTENAGKEMDVRELFYVAVILDNINLIKYLSKYRISFEMYQAIVNNESFTEQLRSISKNIILAYDYIQSFSGYIPVLKKSIGIAYRRIFDGTREDADQENLTEEQIADSLLQYTANDNLPEEITGFVLMLLYKFSDFNNVKKLSNHNNDSMTIYQYICSLTEIIILYLSVLNHYNKLMGIDKQYFTTDKIIWVFDNSNNPIEKQIEKYMLTHPEIKKINGARHFFGREAEIPADIYDKILNSTYDYDRIIQDMQAAYPEKLLQELFCHIENKQELTIDRAKFNALTTCHFFMDCNLDKYLRE